MAIAAPTDLIRLRAGALELELCPPVGGCITLLAPPRPRSAAPGATAFPRAARPARGRELPAGAVLEPRGRRPLRLRGHRLPARSQLPAGAPCDPWPRLAACLDARRGERAGGGARARPSRRRHAARLPRAPELRARRGRADGQPGAGQPRRRRDAGGLRPAPLFPAQRGRHALRTPRPRLARRRAQAAAGAHGAAGRLGLRAHEAPCPARDGQLLRRLGRPRGDRLAGARPPPRDQRPTPCSATS